MSKAFRHKMVDAVCEQETQMTGMQFNKAFKQGLAKDLKALAIESARNKEILSLESIVLFVRKRMDAYGARN